MGKISGSGISITLYNKVLAGTDGFDRPIYREEAETVENVLVGEPSSQEIIDTLNLTGKRAAYTLGIPKGDTHVWTDRKVEFNGEIYRVIGKPTQGIEALIPLDWNKKCMVESIE